MIKLFAAIQREKNLVVMRVKIYFMFNLGTQVIREQQISYCKLFEQSGHCELDVVSIMHATDFRGKSRLPESYESKGKKLFQFEIIRGNIIRNVSIQILTTNTSSIRVV